MQDFALYVDLDGVLADFDAGAVAHGFDASALDKTRDSDGDAARLAKEAFFDAIAFSPFYAQLPFMHDGVALWEALKPYDPIILTGLPSFKHREDAKQAHLDAGEKKRAWCARHLGLEDEAAVICTFARKKPKYVRHRPTRLAILIDDRERNINEWQRAGGAGIVHVSAEDTLDRFYALVKAGG